MFRSEDFVDPASRIAFLHTLQGKQLMETAVLNWALQHDKALREAGLLQELLEVMQKEINK